MEKIQPRHFERNGYFIRSFTFAYSKANLNYAERGIFTDEEMEEFSYALHGMKLLILDEHNARIHITATIGAVAAGFLLEVSLSEWLFIALAIGLVFISELMNTAIERLADRVELQKDDLIGQTKDLAAGAVFVSALLAMIIGALIFLPKLLALI